MSSKEDLNYTQRALDVMVAIQHRSLRDQILQEVFKVIDKAPKLSEQGKETFRGMIATKLETLNKRLPPALQKSDPRRLGTSRWRVERALLRGYGRERHDL